MDASDQVEVIISKIQNYVFPRRIRVSEFFVNFDPLKSGFCTETQFARAVCTSGATAGARLTENEVRITADHFTDTSKIKPNVVNYYKFCAAIDEIFAADSLEVGAPSNAMMAGSPNSTLRETLTQFIPQPVEDEEKMMHVLHRVAAMCRSRGIIFKAVFFDFERAAIPSPSRVNPIRGGKVTRPQFIRNFPFKKEFTEEEVELLADRYTCLPGDDVNFQAIHNDISEVLSPEPPPCPKSDLYLKADETMWDHMMLNPVKKIQSKTVEKRVRLREWFKDFDPLRKGFCTAGQLKTALTTSSMDKEVSKDDFQHLLEVYSRADGMFCYDAFCKDVDFAFGMPNLEKDPLMKTPLPDYTTTAPARRNRICLDPQRREEITLIEERLRARVMKERINLKPTFKDMDKANRGVVSRNQFTRCMGMLGWELSQEELSLLCAAYCDRGNHNDFNYTDLIQCIDPPDDDQETAMQQLNSPYQDEVPSKYFNGMKIIPMGSM